MNDSPLSEDLNALAHEFRRQSLAANVPNRDRLMFECGRAAARPRPKRNSSRTAWMRQALLVAGCVCFGAMATRWIVPAEVVVVQMPPTFPTVDEPELSIAKVNPRLAERYSEMEMAAVRSGQLLCASSPLSALNSFSTSPGPYLPVSDSPSMRAGMRNQLTGSP